MSCIDNCTNPQEISGIFNDQYRATSLQDCADEFNTFDCTNRYEPLNTYFCMGRIGTVIVGLKPSFGWDSLHSNHVKFAGKNLGVWLVECFLRF